MGMSNFTSNCCARLHASSWARISEMTSARVLPCSENWRKQLRNTTRSASERPRSAVPFAEEPPWGGQGSGLSPEVLLHVLLPEPTGSGL